MEVGEVELLEKLLLPPDMGLVSVVFHYIVFGVIVLIGLVWGIGERLDGEH